MSLLRLRPFSREVHREIDAPLRPSRQREISPRPCAGAPAERPDEGPYDAFVRRREKYAAAVVLAVAISAALAETAWADERAGDANRGEQIYEACQDCHSLDKNDVGPRHRGVFGRKAASLPDYDYSDALKSANIVWNEETLDKWLTDPQAVAPGAKMFFHLESAQDRADVIAYLRERAK
jgi:cytochrome c